MTGSRITGLGIALPAREVTSGELETRLGLTRDWIVERTGIRSRRVASATETTSSLGISAAREALAAAEKDAHDVDLIICATVTSDHRFPATACMIQSGLSANSAAFDLNAGCSGFLVALAQADAAIKAGASRCVLVVGCEVLSRITDQNDRGTAVLFGDGAGAAVLESSDVGPRVGPFILLSDGSRPDLLYVNSENDRIVMRGRDVYRAAVDGMTSSVSELLSSCRMEPRDVDVLVAHQANGRILSAVAQRLGIPLEKVVTNIERRGNTSAASIPLALYEAERTGALREDDVIVLTAFGAGFVWGAGVVRWGTGAGARTDFAGAGRVHV